LVEWPWPRSPIVGSAAIAIGALHGQARYETLRSPLAVVVVPAKERHPGMLECGTGIQFGHQNPWTPAFAGATKFEQLFVENPVALSFPAEPKYPSSFRRKNVTPECLNPGPESRNA
jgi:hypothetical protein